MFRCGAAGAARRGARSARPPARRSFIRENAIRTATLLLAALSLVALDAARAGDTSNLPRVSIEDGRIHVRRSDLAAPEVSSHVQGPGGPLSAPAEPGRRTIVETNILGQDTEWAGLKPRLRLGYGIGDGASPTSGYSDVYIRGVLIREFE